MSFLTPLYIAGALAVALPIVFHMIRRTPQGRTPFSTLMFLDPSPPRMRNRSRLENWPLLLLRAAILCLLAAAFARPFLRNAVSLKSDNPSGRRIAVLLDASASMRRAGLWDHAVRRATLVVETAGPHDRVSIQTFDRRVHTIVTADEWSAVDAAARRNLAVKRLSKLEPGWAATDLGEAVVNTVESLNATSDESTAFVTESEVVLISDMQSGSRLDALQTFQWPPRVRLRVEQVTPETLGNAGIQFASSSQTSDDEDDRLRVRVSNAADSTTEQFQLHWRGDGLSESSTGRMDVYVSAGKSRIVRLPDTESATEPIAVTLSGDGHEFDNAAWFARPATVTATVAYFGEEAADDPEGHRYYVERAFPATPRRNVRVVDQNDAAPVLNSDAYEIGLVIVAGQLSDEQLTGCRRWVEAGGTLLCVVDGPVCETAANLLRVDDLDEGESEIDGYAMWGETDFTHPLTADFADARFADFTQIHFWRHRKLNVSSLADARIVARFDDGDPLLVDVPIGSGRVLLTAAAWRPSDGQLATSSKFVPLLNAMLDLSTGRPHDSPVYQVGDRVPLADVSHNPADVPAVHTPTQGEIRLSAASDEFDGAIAPGVYTVTDASSPVTMERGRFTVNLAADESRTAPLPSDALESLGVRFTQSNDQKAAAVEKARQLRVQELESRQKLWRWLIVAALACVLCETWLAGRCAGNRS